MADIAATGKCPKDFTQYFKSPTKARKTKGPNIKSSTSNPCIRSEKNISNIEKSSFKTRFCNAHIPSSLL